MNTRDKWLPEVQDNLRDVPIFLVGLKADLRDEMPENAVSTQRGEALVGDLGASQYWEVSSKTNTNVSELFNAAVSVVLQKRSGNSQSAAAAGNAPQQQPAAAADTGKSGGGCCTLL